MSKSLLEALEGKEKVFFVNAGIAFEDAVEKLNLEGYDSMRQFS